MFQYDLVVHVAELFLLSGPSCNPIKAQVWLDKAAAALPGDPKVFNLKVIFCYCCYLLFLLLVMFLRCRLGVLFHWKILR